MIGVSTTASAKPVESKDQNLQKIRGHEGVNRAQIVRCIGQNAHIEVRRAETSSMADSEGERCQNRVAADFMWRTSVTYDQRIASFSLMA